MLEVAALKSTRDRCTIGIDILSTACMRLYFFLIRLILVIHVYNVCIINFVCMCIKI